MRDIHTHTKSPVSCLQARRASWLCDRAAGALQAARDAHLRHDGSQPRHARCNIVAGETAQGIYIQVYIHVYIYLYVYIYVYI